MIIIISGVAAVIFIAILCVGCGGSSFNQNNGYQNNRYGDNSGNMGNVVNCSCGFTYNKRNHDSCPNCGRRN